MTDEYIDNWLKKAQNDIPVCSLSLLEQTLENELKRIKREQLIDAYHESAQEAEQENQFFDGVSGI